ncbi:MAG: hypothetical protein M0029_06595 [Actinomycetota bacterium]|jgi:hypothetical protein|nr:hypothetical protein [Actinomycetota bacterium]
MEPATSDRALLGRRQVRAVLGALWLLDAALQCRPRFFHARAWQLGVAQSVMGEPTWVSRWTSIVVGLIAAHPALLDGVVVAVQVGLGLALLLDRLPRSAVVVSVPYAIGVWWVGEGLGVLPTGFAQAFAGAPGPALLYPVLGLLAWPSRQRRDLPDRPLAPAAVLVWCLLWAGQALFEVPWRYPGAVLLSANLDENALGAPRWLLPVVHRVSSAVAAAPVATLIALGAVGAGVGLGVLLPSRRRAALAVGLVVSAAFWVVGQCFGGVLTGGATDPGTAPLVALLALGLWPMSPRPTATAADPLGTPSSATAAGPNNGR